MKLIEDIINLLSDGDGNLTEALFKTKIVLHKIGHKELVEWVNNELNGYSESDQLPPYRILHAQVLANVGNTSYQYRATPIPIMHLDEAYRESLETTKMTQSLAMLEKILDSDGNRLRQFIPMEATPLLGKSLASGFQIQTAWIDIDLSEIASLATQVRSRLLDFLLELNESFSDNMSDEEIKQQATTTDTKNLFKNVIFGDNATVNVGNRNSQHINATVMKGDFESLAKILMEYGVEKSDVNSLKDAIAADVSEGDPQHNKFGSSVGAWLQTMFSKALDTSWQIEIGVVSSLLASALQRFYGWK